MFSDSDSSSHQIVFSAGRHQRVDPLQGDRLSCVAFLSADRLEDFDFPKHYLLPSSVEAGPNPSDGRGALCQAALSSSAVTTEPKQQHPGNVNTVSFSVEQKRAENGSNTLCVCLRACMCVSVQLEREN